ncbi:MAG: hypothetical protein EXS37_12820 [Opitutus sp.]|nr:hypothetical protein [Opitutus sp.]
MSLVLVGTVLAAEKITLAPSRYLFLDPAILAASHRTDLTVNPAQRRETVIRPDRLWEQLMISFYLTVRDEGGKLRLWYICRDKANHPNVAYAESLDGIAWTKPDLGIVDHEGSKANNLVGLTNLEGVVFSDPRMPAGERYQYVTRAKPATNPAGPAGIYRFHSPDGLHWNRDDVPLIRSGSDTQNVTFWDERMGAYAVYIRGWTGRIRRVLRVTLPDLKTPLVTIPKLGEGKYFDDELPVVLQCDAQDPARTDIYDMAAQPYPLDASWYVAFPAFLRRSVASAAPGYLGSHKGSVEVQFAGSRDGIAWHRHDRAAYAPPGIAAPEKKNMSFMGTGLVVRGDEIWQYGTEFESEHGDMAARHKKTDGVIVRWVQRVDGFVSANTGAAEGTLRTVPVRVTGEKLVLNLDTGALGELRVALLDAAGQPIAGFGADKCTPLQINSTGAAVAWAGGSALAGLRGREVRLEFRSHRTRLYSFRFE